MLNQTPTSPRYFTAIGMLLALCLPMAALCGFPRFLVGYWNDEPIMFVIFIVSMLSALWIALGLAFGFLSLTYQRTNLLLTLWLGWIAWQALATAASAMPWRSWFGPPEQSEGLAWYLCASVFMLQLSALWQHPRFRKILIGSMFGIMFLLAVLHFISDPSNNLLAGFIFPYNARNSLLGWLPFIWPDYLGHMAAWGWIALMLTFPAMKLRWQAALTLLLLFVLLASSNRIAFVLLGYALLVSLIIRIIHTLKLPHFTTVSPAWRQLAMVATLAPVVWLLASPYIPTNYSTNQAQSIPTRILSNHIAMAAVADEPSRLLLGRGWGHYEDDFYRYSLIRDIRIYDDGKHRPNWPMVRGYNYHSHDMATETLLSLGLVGMLLWLIMPAVAIRSLPAPYFWQVVPMLVAATILQHLWFSMPQTMPFQALCWFLLMRGAGGIPVKRRYGATAILLVSASLAWSAVQQYQAMEYTRRLSDPFGYQYGKTLDADFMQQDIKRGGDRLRSYFTTTTKRMASANLQPKHIALYGDYLQSMRAMSEHPGVGAYNATMLLYGYNTLISVFKSEEFAGLRREASRNYLELAKLHAARSPYREDAIAPFLSALWHSPGDPDHAKLMRVVQELLAIHPLHRSALWMGGKVLSAQPDYAEQGRDMMDAALKLGADRVYMIPKSEVR